MKKIKWIVGFSMMMGLVTISAQASENQCESAALKMAKAIRMVEMPKKARKAEFTIVSAGITSESETYTIQMLVRGEKIMVDQRLEMVGGATCVLAGYEMPGAG